jgi:competence protein ComEA
MPGARAMLKNLVAGLALFHAAVSFAALDLNQASAAELDSLKGVGPGLSGRILGERQKGDFRNWKDFIGRVKGMGEGNAARLSAQGLTIHGTGYTGPADHKDSPPAPGGVRQQRHAGSP